MVELPDKPKQIKRVSPKVLTLYGKPKIGKTTIISGLPNALILDFENGCEYLETNYMQIIGLKLPRETPEQTELRHKAEKYYLIEVRDALRLTPNKYEFLVFDTATKLSEMCMWEATYTYMNSTMGKNANKWTLEDEQLSRGKVQAGTYKPREKWETVVDILGQNGWRWLWNEYRDWIAAFTPLVPQIILIAHVKTSRVIKKADVEVESKDLALTGTIRDITTREISDAVGYIYREENKCFISFHSDDTTESGSRSAKLSDKTILISEKLENGEILVHWNEIYGKK